MGVLVLAMLVLAMTGRASCTWCVCKDLSDAVLQKTLDYACGAGADCAPTHQNGPCFQPNTVKAHCSYAVNSFFQKKNQAPGTCDFSGSAAISTSDPSVSGCSYPASLSSAGTTTTPVTTPPGTTTPSTTTPGTTTPSTTTPGTTTPSTTTPGTTTPSSTTPTTTTPYSTTPSNGVFGTGAGPSGMNTDITDAGLKLESMSFISISVTLLVSGLMLLWG